MRFECEPQLILTKEEFEIITKALELCEKMDNETEDIGCTICPRADQCERVYSVCPFTKAVDGLQNIKEMAIVK